MAVNGPDQALNAKPTRQSLADSIYEILLNQLIEGAIQAGSSINIDSMSRDLAVSPTPIREALARLEATGLVQREALRGYRAAPLFTAEQLRQLMEARLVLEAPLARYACLNRTDGFLDALRANVADMRNLAMSSERGHHSQYREIDERFHDLIAQQADNPFLFRAYKSLEAHVQRFRLFGAMGASDMEHALHEHGLIIDAFAAADPELVYSQMCKHIEQVRVRSVRDREQINSG
ncbi:GntR family transcriptional regulator [Stackebrandtia endophytica]|uniref:GntR family transcriptional regulator n=1 Tax=Stackebrandtia endophytica TaxID=1496996 RepID=A0A543ATK4_9ACTN|nr:GntR family transcriptional regulator [Stackebrandtia endophytica]TQL75902.1 GntR family transcriptional regulator [Stackebrandtia endophytica]